MEEILQHKTRELLELKKRKLELELEATKKHLEEQEKHLCKTTEGVIPSMEALVAAVTSVPPPMLPPPSNLGYASPMASNTAIEQVCYILFVCILEFLLLTNKNHTFMYLIN